MLKLGHPTDPRFETECLNPDVVKEDKFLVRPCERYRELFKSCSSLKNRIYQYYIYGETIDCRHYKEHHDNCMAFRKTRDTNHLDSIIDWEKKYIEVRKMSEKQNDVWQPRKAPPTSFDGPLPEFIQNNHRNSYLKR